MPALSPKLYTQILNFCLGMTLENSFYSCEVILVVCNIGQCMYSMLCVGKYSGIAVIN